MLKIGDRAPAFELKDQNGQTVSSSVFEGRWGVLWWYPEANSGGCSIQAMSLDRSLDKLTERGVVVVGISFNTEAENNDFACDKTLRLTLLSDPDRRVGTSYDVVREPGEKFADKPRRTTYVIAPDGRIAHAEDANTVPLQNYGEHILEVLDRLQGVQGERS